MLAYFVPVLIALSCAMAAPQEQTEFSQSLSQFSTDLYEKLAAKSTGNLIYSPLSISFALGLAAQGSQGATFDQIKSTLHMTGNQEAIADQFGASQLELAKNTGKVTLNVANKVYVKNNYELKPAFKEVAEKKFNSEGESVDFADSVPTAAKINGWVETKTNSKIKDLIKPDSLDTDTRLVLVNAIYFKGNWRNQFKEENTYKDKFWTSEDKSIDVDMMHIKADFKFGTFEDLDATALEMPYNDSDISFLVLLPNKRTGLKDLEAKLKTINLADLTSNMYKSEVEVSLPKFRSEYEIELTEPLKELGLKKIFEDADFSNMLTSPEPLQVSSIVHKAFIEVNEQGAEAAAATAVSARKKRCAVARESFEVNRPFFYAIRSIGDFALPLFCGSLTIPSPAVTVDHDEL